jgi:hypothetical protein
MPTNYTTVPAVFGADDTVTATYSERKFPLGMYREEDGKGYRFVRFDNGSGNVASSAGAVGHWLNDTGTDWVLTTDTGDSSRNKVRGIFLGEVTDQYYCWVQTKGACYVASASGAEGDAVISSATDATATVVAAGTAPTHKVIGFALAAQSGGLILTDLQLD